MVYLIIIIALWELYWTITACWLASKRGDKGWFIFFLTFTLLGIPEIIYVRKYKSSLSPPIKSSEKE